jgi:hypothetical protein
MTAYPDAARMFEGCSARFAALAAAGLSSVILGCAPAASQPVYTVVSTLPHHELTVANLAGHQARTCAGLLLISVGAAMVFQSGQALWRQRIRAKKISQVGVN